MSNSENYREIPPEEIVENTLRSHHLTMEQVLKLKNNRISLIAFAARQVLKDYQTFLKYPRSKDNLTRFCQSVNNLYQELIRANDGTGNEDARRGNSLNSGMGSRRSRPIRSSRE